MKVMVGVDMEGITGIVSRDYTARDGRLYREGAELMAGDINATVAGLLDAGVDEVIVWDNHAGALNAPFTKLHPGARYVRGVPANRLRWPELDGSFSGLILLGYHAKAGTAHAVLEHTMSSADWCRLKVNGREIGEIAIDGALAGAVGVPVIMVSGDDKLCAEAKDLFGEDVTAVCVKRGLARHSATCLPAEKTAELIRAGAAEAVANAGKCKPLNFGSPVEVELTFKHTEHADAIDLRLHSGRRIDGYTVRWTCPDMAAWFGYTSENRPPFGPASAD